MVRYNDGLTGWQRYRLRYPERVKLLRRLRYRKDPERHQAYSQTWRKKNPGKVKKQYKRWLKSNRARRAAINKAYDERHPDKVKARRLRHYRKNHSNIRAYFKRYLPKYRRKLRDTNPLFMLVERMRSRLRACLAKFPVRKSARTFELIGCTPTELKAHIESLFVPGMSWANRHLWHVDHNRPLASFDLRDPEQQRAAFHYTNLQPLWSEENRRKGAKLVA